MKAVLDHSLNRLVQAVDAGLARINMDARVLIEDVEQEHPNAMELAPPPVKAVDAVVESAGTIAAHHPAT